MKPSSVLSVLPLLAALLCAAGAIRINCGGPTLPGIVADSPSFRQTAGSVFGFSNTGGLPISEYGTHSWTPGAPLIYAIPADPAKTYKLTLRFAENWQGAAASRSRVFDIAINDAAFQSGVDVWSLAGNLLFTPVNLVKTAVTPVGGVVKITLTPTIGNAMISGIDVEEELATALPTPTASASAVATTGGGSSAFSLKVNCGGPSLAGGIVADTPADYSQTTVATGVFPNVANQVTVYQNHRYSLSMTPLVYAFNVNPASTYSVVLRFAENWSGAGSAGARLFNIAINDVVVASNVDVFTLSGGLNEAYNFARGGVSAPGGNVKITIIPVRQNAMINGIDIVEESSGSLPTVTPTSTASSITPSATPTASSTPGASLTASPSASASSSMTPSSFSTPTPSPSITASVSATSTQNATPSPSASVPVIPSVTWQQITPNYPKKVFEAQGTVMGNAASGFYLVVIGGFFNFPGHTNEVYQRRLDSGNGAWERLADMPETLTHMAQWTDGVELCGVGGFIGPSDPGRSVSSAWCFHRANNVWRALAPLPADRAGGGLIMTPRGGKRILIYSSGVDREFDNFSVHIDYGDTWFLDMDDPLATWQGGLPNMPMPRNHIGSVETCGRYFFLGGQFKLDEITGNSDRVDEWLPNQQIWSSNPPAPLPFPVGHISASVMPYKCGMIVVGGIANARTLVRTVSYWEPTQNKWYSIGDYPFPTATPVCGIMGKTIYCATGGNSWIRERVFMGTIVD